MAELGRAALVISLGLSVYAVVAGAVAAVQNRRRLATSARNALFIAFGTTLIAAAVLATALVRHDFSFVYVASHTNRTLPTAYALSDDEQKIIENGCDAYMAKPIAITEFLELIESLMARPRRAASSIL